MVDAGFPDADSFADVLIAHRIRTATLDQFLRGIENRRLGVTLYHGYIPTSR